MNDTEFIKVIERYKNLYSGAIADILDKLGYRNQVLPHYISPYTKNDKLIGQAFTGQGYKVNDPTNNDMPMRLSMMDEITPNSISVWACGGHTGSAHFGELMACAAREHGCNGAVIDGGVRDVDFLNNMSYPVFAHFKCAASSIGRWEIVKWQVPIKIGDTIINPEDLVFGDTDGVIIVPKEKIMDVIDMAEDIHKRESCMRAEMRQGLSFKKAFEKYGVV